jgi:hypothetical protein
MKPMICLLFSAILFSGCSLQQKEEALKKKEAELNQKEQELILREKTLQFKEEELTKKQMRLDSVAKDSSLLVHPDLTGAWSTKMTCVETTCAGSAVGDTKTEQWIIAYEADHIIAKAMTNNKLTRVYTGSFNGNTIELSQESEVADSEPSATMTVRLMVKDSTNLEGQREIVRDNNCKIVYALQMQKQNG